MLIVPGARHGSVPARASKSHAHRLLILAALGAGECFVDLENAYSRDTDATARCLAALGADIVRVSGGYRVRPIAAAPLGGVMLDCGESGATLRFVLPLCGALGAEAKILTHGRLGARPIAALENALTARGMTLHRAADGALCCTGALAPGEYTLDATLSSQFVSALLLALPRLDGASRLAVTGEDNSAGYIALTERALASAGIDFERHNRTYIIPGNQRPALPPCVRAEGDWSGAAAFLCMGALSGQGVSVTGLDACSAQPDRAVVGLLRGFGAEVTETPESVFVRGGARLVGAAIDAAPAPDLVPVLAALAACAEGETRIYNAARLRQKESDRLAATARLINDLGGAAQETADGLIIRGVPRLRGGTARSAHDHRIAMAAAVCACQSAAPVELDEGECVEKSYADFWSDFESLKTGGDGHEQL